MAYIDTIRKEVKNLNTYFNIVNREMEEEDAKKKAILELKKFKIHTGPTLG